MPFTREQVNDVKMIIKETVKELLNDDNFISLISNKLEQKMGITEIKQKVNDLNQTLAKLQQENKQLRGEIDRFNQHTKRKSLRINGVSENPGENLPREIVSLCKDKCRVEIAESDLENCFRIGRVQNGKSRTVLVTFTNQVNRQRILQNRKSLKGTPLTIVEDMTQYNYQLLRRAKDKYGKHNAWYYGGQVRVNINGVKSVVKCLEDIDGF
nr:unnamed protein product [Callosobruchus chinensis]CAH7758424.1 unnamed protein product [Callosobruchus chinensis]